MIRNLYRLLEKRKQYSKYVKEFPAPPYDIWKYNSSNAPQVYNVEGRQYEYYYLRDIHSAAIPYDDIGKYFIWDRYNYAFPTHFYSHREMFINIGKPDKKYGMMIESRAIVPEDYLLLRKKRGFEREFEKILTFDDELLNDFSNAVYVPFSAAPWYGRDNGLEYEENRHKMKSKELSFLASNKRQTDVHRKRFDLARYCNRNKLCDVYGKAVGGGFVSIDDTLRDYRFSFAIENYQSDYYFTEKITNCFAAQTIPIYFGARKIDEFFNPDGIIFLKEKDFDNIENVIKCCSESEYQRRIPAVLDNYYRVLNKYMNIQDYIYENYLMAKDKCDIDNC